MADDESNRVAALLKLSGIMRTEGNQLKPRNRIYERVFDQTWIRENMPGQELRRQRRAFWLGVARTSGVALIVVAIIGYFYLVANRAQRVAREAEKHANEANRKLDYQLYVANMNNMQLFDQQGDTLSMGQTLEQTSNSPYRGWEWGYWNGTLHDSDEEYVVDSPNRDKNPTLFGSPDRSQILIQDHVLEIGFVIDRSTRKLLGRYRILKNETPMWTKAGWIAFNGNAPVVVVRNLRSGAPIYEQDLSDAYGHYAVTFPDSCLLETQEMDQISGSKIQVLDGATGACIWRGASPHNAWITDISRNRLRLLQSVFKLNSDHIDNQLIDLRAGKVVSLPPSNSANVPVLSPSGHLAVYHGVKAFSIYDLDRRRTIMTLPSDRNQIASVSVSEDDLSVYCTMQDQHLEIRSIPSAKLLSEYKKATRSIYSGAPLYAQSGPFIRILNPQRRNLQAWPAVSMVSRSYKGGFIARRNQTPIEQTTLSDPDLVKVGTARVLSDTNGSFDGRLTMKTLGKTPNVRNVISESATGRILLTENGNNISFPISAARADFFLAESADNRRLSCYKFGDAKPIWVFRSNLDMRADFAADASLVVVGTDNEFAVLDGETGQKVRTYETAPGSTFNQCGFVFGTRDYWLSTTGSLKVYEGESHRPKMSVERPGIILSYLDISPDGSRILVSAARGLQICDSATGKRLLSLDLANTIQSALFTSDGRKLLSASYPDSPLRVFESRDTDSVVRIPVGPLTVEPKH